jgi:hypothetical protein
VSAGGRPRSELDRLTAALDELAWQEQVEAEYAERHLDQVGETAAEDGLRELAGSVTPELLDALERVPGYAAWVLRLSPLVPGDDPRARATRHREDPSARVRFWAARLLDRG